MKKLITFLIGLCLLALMFSCHSSKWYLDKAIAKGLKIDTSTKVRIDTFYLNSITPVKDNQEVAINYDSLEKLCATLNYSLSLDSTFMEPSSGNTVNKKVGENVNKIGKKIQKQICPQVDSLYQILIFDSNGKGYKFPIHVIVEGGLYKLETWKFKLPYNREEKTDLQFQIIQGYSLKTLLLWCVISFVGGMLLLLIKKYSKG